MSTEDLLASFPKLLQEGYDPTSPDDQVYNCAAWAMREQHVWWEPRSAPRQYPHKGPTFWPDGVPNSLRVEAYVAAFATRGFTVCDSGEWNPNYEKIAIYRDFE